MSLYLIRVYDSEGNPAINDEDLEAYESGEVDLLRSRLDALKAAGHVSDYSIEPLQTPGPIVVEDILDALVEQYDDDDGRDEVQRIWNAVE